MRYARKCQFRHLYLPEFSSFAVTHVYREIVKYWYNSVTAIKAQYYKFISIWPKDNHNYIDTVKCFKRVYCGVRI